MLPNDKIKNVLCVKNNPVGQDLEFLEKFFNINIHQISSLSLVDKSLEQIDKLVDQYDIIILGGGPQHLTKQQICSHPEIPNQIEIVKKTVTKSKLLIGICLGCQIIGLAFGLEIIQMDKLCLGYEFLDINSINQDYISKSNDLYLSKFDYNLLAKSLCFHYDQVSIGYDNQELVLIASSKTKVPYIIKHIKAKIYGFQFHPESTLDYVQQIQFKKDILLTNPDISNILINNFDSNVLFHFFQVFFSN